MYYIKPDSEFILDDSASETSPVPQDTYTACTVVEQMIKDNKHQIMTGYRTIIEDIVIWSNCVFLSLLMF